MLCISFSKASGELGIWSSSSLLGIAGLRRKVRIQAKAVLKYPSCLHGHAGGPGHHAACDRPSGPALPVTLATITSRITTPCYRAPVCYPQFGIKIMSMLADRITVDPEQCGGRPCVRGMRIRVSDVLDLLANGLSTEQVLEELPD